MPKAALSQREVLFQTQLLDAIATLSQPKELVSQEQWLVAIDVLAKPQIVLTQELLLSAIAALSDSKEQLEALAAVVKEMYATLARLNKAEPDILRLDQVSSFIDWVKGRVKLRKPGKVIGETGLGKTSACHACLEEFEQIHPPNQVPELPILYVQIDDNRCAPGKFLQLILVKLKKPTSGSLHQLKQRVKKFFNQYKVQVLLVDEAHCLHFDALKTVRSFFDDKELKVIPILIGTSNRLDSLLEKDEQVRDRFSNTFVFEEFIGEKFRQVLEIWGKNIIKMQDPLDMENKRRSIPLLKMGRNGVNADLAILLEEMTSGELRLVDDILRDAANRLLERKLRQIYELVLQALITENRALNLDIKKFLRDLRIDKPFLQSFRGEYSRGKTA